MNCCSGTNVPNPNKPNGEYKMKEEQGTPSPLSKSTNPHPDPKRK